MEKIKNWVEEKSPLSSYAKLCYNIIQRHWSDLDTKTLKFLHVNSSAKRKVMYTIAEVCNLTWSSETSKNSKNFINRKLINKINNEGFYDITYHSITCQDCPEITHKGECCSIPNHRCKLCDSLPCLTIYKEYKNICMIAGNIRKDLVDIDIFSTLKISGFTEPTYELIDK